MKSANSFHTVKIEGAILSADLLRRLIDGDSDLPGLRAEDYHLDRAERLNEAAARAWNRLRRAWEGFRTILESPPESDKGRVNLTLEKWLLILFQELGYGRLTARKAYEVKGRTYPVSRAWQNTPIHLVSYRQELDKRTPGVRGAARSSPHSLVQELLNQDDESLWGFVSNGLKLRFLRDNKSLTRQAYLEFDLQVMMESEAYSDFFLLYLLGHQSRVEVPEGKGPEHCWLEKWYNTSVQQGVRALDQLRDGVQKAIETFGGGFLAHQANYCLRERLSSGALSKPDYYQQIIRLVYRLLFLFVAEDRELLFDPATPPEACKLYMEHYSTRRLRTLAGKIRGTRHPDLWRGLRLVLNKLHCGSPQLGLPALGGFLFSAQITPDINEADISNSDLLKAINALAFTQDRQIRRQVNYRHLGPEELGSVYESLLEMHPEINIQATNLEDRFRLTVMAGSERKTTGSYYTPASLVNCLLDSALDPVLDEACQKTDSENALLALKVCDPACGSGHFLISAAHRLAKRLAFIRSGEAEPAPEHYRQALRDVIGISIYGVDLNPMSVELCKVSLWMEAMQPGRPLAFLDHHIRCGNSLLGATPVLLAAGIPDNAFKPIEGDDKAYCTQIRSQNRKERKVFEFGHPPILQPWERLGDLTGAMVNLDHMPDDTTEAVQKKQKRYYELVRSSGYLSAHLLADAWCAAFVMKKAPEQESGLPYPITERDFRAIEESPHSASLWLKNEIQRLAEQYKFFHWHLEFPDVFRVPATEEKPENALTGWSGGFDCVLGNPPWERVKLQEKEWFAQRVPTIAAAPNAAMRQRRIEALKQDHPTLYNDFVEDRRKSEGESALLRNSKRFPFCGQGDVNTYSVFAELMRSLVRPGAWVGCITPSGLATDDTLKYFFRDLMDSGTLVSFYDFENRNGIFPAVDSRIKFALVTMRQATGEYESTAEFAFFLHQTDDLRDTERRFFLTAKDMALLNPNTYTAPIFRTHRDAELAKHLYRRLPVLHREDDEHHQAKNQWNIKFLRMFDMSNDSGLFKTRTKLESENYILHSNIFERDGQRMLPLYEAKLFHQFDHRFATYESALGGTPQTRVMTATEKTRPEVTALPRYWVPEAAVTQKLDRRNRGWLLAFRRITNSTNERTMISSAIGNFGSGDSAFLYSVNPNAIVPAAMLLANFNSLALDWATRLSIGGTNMNFFIVKQLPVLPPDAYLQKMGPGQPTLLEWLTPRVLELVYTGWELTPFAEDLGYDGPPFIWDEERRFQLRCEIDAAFFLFYLGSAEDWENECSTPLRFYFPTPLQAIEHIMDSFPILRQRDEVAYSAFRTKETIISLYVEMVRVSTENAAARAAGREPIDRYQTRLSPPPGPPTDSQGRFIPMSHWDYANWPPHIHQPHGEATSPPEKMSLDDFMALAYPSTDTDQAICAAALSLVEQSGRLSSMEHLDALLLTTHPDWCKVFLDQNGQAELAIASKSAPANLFVGKGQSIKWKQCLDHLKKLHAITLTHNRSEQPTISPGTQLTSIRANFPPNTNGMVKCALLALNRVHQLRDDLSSSTPDQRVILNDLAYEHQKYSLAA